MNEQNKNRFINLIAEEIEDMYGCTEKEARKAVRKSEVVKLLDEQPEFVDHVPLSSWTESIWAGKLSRRFGG